MIAGIAVIPPGKDSPAYSGLLSTHAEALGSTEKIKRQPTLKSRPSSKDPFFTLEDARTCERGHEASPCKHERKINASIKITNTVTNFAITTAQSTG
jgi:hypothetical protein